MTAFSSSNTLLYLLNPQPHSAAIILYYSLPPPFLKSRWKNKSPMGPYVVSRGIFSFLLEDCVGLRGPKSSWQLHQ